MFVRGREVGVPRASRLFQAGMNAGLSITSDESTTSSAPLWQSPYCVGAGLFRLQIATLRELCKLMGVNELTLGRNRLSIY